MSEQTIHNISLVKKILQACKNFEHRKSSVKDLQDSIELYGPLLEGVDSRVFATLYKSSNDLEEILYACLEEKQYERTCKVIEEIYSFVYETFGDIEL